MNSLILTRLRIRCLIAGWMIALTGSTLWSQESAAVSPLRGYLFIDSEYVPPPYQFEATEESIQINGRELDESYFGSLGREKETGNRPSRSVRRPGMMRGRRPPRGGRGFDENHRSTQAVSRLQQATNNGIVVLYQDTPPMTIHTGSVRVQLLGLLVGDQETDAKPPAYVLASDQATWKRLTSEFQAGSDFLARAGAELEQVREVVRADERASAAKRFVAQISYPLTVFAMILVVLAFGHLLSHRPAIDLDPEDATLQNRVVVRSLVLIALLSSIDLIWTLAATDAGAMTELNPLGSRFIGDPAQLVLFKLAVTSAPIAILYFLHRRPVAQIASWWCCLLLTLLTARWVVFQSMFV